VLDHVSLRVTDYDRSKRFYEAALAPLGYVLAMETDSGAFVLDRDGYNIEAVCHKSEA
jgi:catechol-2,3-dioxygenase